MTARLWTSNPGGGEGLSVKRSEIPVVGEGQRAKLLLPSRGGLRQALLGPASMFRFEEAGGKGRFDLVVRELHRQEGKVAVITGCTTGIGLIAAKEFARLGGKVLMLNRASGRTAKAEAAVKHVAAAEANVTSVVCDLADFSSVRQAAAAVIQSCPNGINILCNNAGVLACPDEATVDGYDLQVQVNHLSHFLLTRELMPLLEARTAMDGDARIIHHSSIARSWPPTPLKAVYLQKNGGNLGGDWHGLMNDGPRFERYHQSKLANAVFHYGLTERLEAAGSSVKSLLVHPGVVRSDIWAEHSGILGNFVGNSIGTPVEEGAVPLLHCMCNSDVQSGQFWGPTGPLGASGPLGLVKPEPWCTDDEAKQMLWKESCCAIGSNFACGLEMDAGIRCPDEHIPEH